MRVIARSTLGKFLETLAGKKDRISAKASLESWFHEVARAKWKNAADVKKSYATASIIDAERVVFNIRGNHYRLVAAIHYQRQTVFVKWLGSHAEYDNIDVRTVQYGDQAYQKRRGS
jgi:mRNA interferase HigB